MFRQRLVHGHSVGVSSKNFNAKERMMNVRMIIAVLMGAILVVLGLPRTASAVYVTIDGGRVFQDGFEGVTPGSAPVAEVGTWTTVTSAGTGSAAVDDDNSPGAFHLNQYMRMTSGTGGGDFSRLKGTFTDAGAIGDDLHAEMMLYVSTRADIVLERAGATAINLRVDSGGNVTAFNGASFVDTGLDIVADTWQLWEIDYTQGDTTFTTSIDGISASGIAVRSGFDGVMDLIAFWPGDNADATLLIDTMPEPTTLTLVGLGGVAVLRRRARR